MLYSRKVGALPGIIAAENVLRSRRDYDLAAQAQQDAAQYRRDYLAGIQEARQAALEDKQFERNFRQKNYDENRRIQAEQSRLDKERYDEDRELRKSKYEREGRIAEENLALTQGEKQRRQHLFDMANLARQRYGNLYPDLDDNELISIGTKISMSPNIDAISAIDSQVEKYVNHKRTYKKSYTQDEESDKTRRILAKKYADSQLSYNPQMTSAEYGKIYQSAYNELSGKVEHQVQTGKEAQLNNIATTILQSFK